MFKKILIAEDFGSTNEAIKITVEELHIPIIDQVFYCDDALLKIQRAILDHNPFELLITDLSFTFDYKHQNITEGKELIQLAKSEQPSLKIIVFSIEDRSSRIQSLISDYPIDAYIVKGRGDTEELKHAVGEIYNGNTYFPKMEDNIITEYDIELIRLLYNNYHITYISDYFKKKKINSNSKSSIYNRISILKKYLKTHSVAELIFEFKRLGYID